MGTIASLSSPSNRHSGNTYIAASDISLPGLGGGLRLTRTWNSIFPSLQNSFPTMFGINWRSTYEERLIYNSPDGLLKYARSDGSVWSFGILTASDPIVYQARLMGCPAARQLRQMSLGVLGEMQLRLGATQDWLNGTPSGLQHAAPTGRSMPGNKA
jgi:hypothetical protein